MSNKKHFCKHDSWKSSCDICALDLEIEELKAENAAHLTTIESQKEEIKNTSLDYCGRIDDLEYQLNEDREELKKCRAAVARFNQATIQLYLGYGEQELTIMTLTDEIESLKAITELAVKGLKWYADEANHEIFDGYGERIKSKVDEDDGQTALKALSEIEKLKNV